MKTEESISPPSTPAASISATTKTTSETPIGNTGSESSLATGPNAGFFLHFDKKLSDCVKKYPCLYDSKTVGYKDKNVTAQYWEMVAKEVQVESGEHAQKLYFNLKKRFHKRRNILKRLTRSGTSNQFALKKAKRDVHLYSFLNWLIPFTQVRQPRTPVIKDKETAAKDEIHQDYNIDRPSFLSGDLKADFNITIPPLDDSAVSDPTALSTSDASDNNEVYKMDDSIDEEIVTVTPQSPIEPRPTYILPATDTTSPTNLYSVSSNSIHLNSTDPTSTLSPPSSSLHTSAVNNLVITAGDACTVSSTSVVGSVNEKKINSIVENIRSANTIRTVNKKSNNGTKVAPAAVLLPRFRYKMTSDTQMASQKQQQPQQQESDSNKINYEDEDYLFGLMIAAELKRFPHKERCIAKHQIQNIIFDMQMSIIKDGQN